MLNNGLFGESKFRFVQQELWKDVDGGMMSGAT